MLPGGTRAASGGRGRLSLRARRELFLKTIQHAADTSRRGAADLRVARDLVGRMYAYLRVPRDLVGRMYACLRVPRTWGAVCIHIHVSRGPGGQDVCCAQAVPRGTRVITQNYCTTCRQEIIAIGLRQPRALKSHGRCQHSNKICKQTAKRRNKVNQ